MKRQFVLGGFAAALAGAAVISVAGWAQQPAQTPPPANFFAVKGYLEQSAVPDSLQLNPPPPAAGSAAEARDIEANKAALALRNSARWELARRDADLFSPNATGTFACAANLAISAQGTPKINALMLRVARDLGGSTRPTKMKYMRQRPFMVNGQSTCTPESDSLLRGDGSYPSGHSAIGYGWGLILAEVVPGRATQLVSRGRAFGDSRRVCNVHWLSDVEEGRVVATAVVARLNADPAFQADLAAARAEAVSLAGKLAPAGCDAESAALAQK